MTESLRTLLAHAIDYAGLFPPARLPLEQSAENFVRYRQSSRSGMVGGFVCPASQLPVLAKQPALSKLQELTLCLVASAAEDTAAAAEALRTDLEQTREFVEEISTTCGVSTRVAIEWRMPPDLIDDESGIPRAIDLLPADIPILLEAFFCEVPYAAAQRHAEALGSFQWRSNVKLALKFRTGGLDAAAFPDSKTLAQAFAACLHAGVPWKCTAGLHHPLPQMDAGVDARMHGFVNVLAASTLGSVHKLNADTLHAILDCEMPEAFAFRDEEMSWQNDQGTWKADVEQIARARETAMASFGSCSCEEPWEDLESLGWLT